MLLSKGIVWVLLCVCVYAHTTTNGILFYNIFRQPLTHSLARSLTNSVTSYDSLIVLNDVTVSLVFNLYVCLYHVYHIEYEHILVDFAFGAHMYMYT